jgi:1-deoxy-D-xylulose-5-phosphate synthase
LLVTIEDNAIAGGAGSAVSEYINAQHPSLSPSPINILHIGFPDELINHGQTDELLADWHLDKSGLLQTIQKRVRE